MNRMVSDVMATPVVRVQPDTSFKVNGVVAVDDHVTWAHDDIAGAAAVTGPLRHLPGWTARGTPAVADRG